VDIKYLSTQTFADDIAELSGAEINYKTSAACLSRAFFIGALTLLHGRLSKSPAEVVELLEIPESDADLAVLAAVANRHLRAQL
jgi:hypothetical protein